MEPKESLQDLFDREDEVRKLREGLSRERLILVLGLRRIGKSSLVLATLSSTGQPFVYIDVRRAYDEVSRRVPAERLYEELRASLLRLSARERVLEALRRMGVSLEYPVKVRVPAEELAAPALRGEGSAPTGAFPITSQGPHGRGITASGPAASLGEARAHGLLSSPAPNSAVKLGQRAYKCSYPLRPKGRSLQQGEGQHS